MENQILYNKYVQKVEYKIIENATSGGYFKVK